MDKQLYVQIENRSLIPFFEPGRDTRRSLTLTTIKDNQRKAIVTVFSKTPEGSNRKLKEYSISPIPRGKAGEPKIELAARALSNRKIELILSLDRRRIVSDTLRLPGRSPWPWIIGLLTLLLLAGAVTWLVFYFTRSSTPRQSAQTTSYQSAAQSKPAATAPAAPQSRQTATVSSQPATTATTPLAQQTTPQAASPPTPAPVPPPATTVRPAATQTNPGQPQPAPSRPLVPVEPVHVNVYFLPDNAELTADTRAELDIIIPQLKRYPDAVVSVNGHCAPHGTEQGRQELSQQRADNIAAYLRRNGIRVDKAAGLGARYPVSLDEQQQYLNRRVEIIQQGD